MMSEYSGFIYLAEILWDHKFLSDVTGCRKTQVSDYTSSTVLSFLYKYFIETGKNYCMS